jgi:hypothetical protein
MHASDPQFEIGTLAGIDAVHEQIGKIVNIPAPGFSGKSVVLRLNSKLVGEILPAVVNRSSASSGQGRTLSPVLSSSGSLNAIDV